ncbi:multidrug export protein EmrB [Paraliobacillus ryukyuensis]|uniref:EmrB/QacA subfamily drug resistance transporter n=1 Tax=Paraliobacillus ryukyuensis TaxID=200904 RepID=A0A366EEE6_9BACI|nr:MDR family MFS transporter [Paraliobacillus ryukyuensis]RBO99788.1 EmrB/QacA subfamily drug resistance transporter [Paraliobacillus ryukyuensis]
MTDENIQNFNRTPIVLVLLAGGFVSILNQTLFATATPHVMEDFQISENIAQWLTTIFMLVNGVMIPITAFLIETFTTRRLVLSALFIFALGTLICGIAPTFPLLMVGRVVQAAGAGIMMPLMMTVFLTIFPIDKRGTAMGTVGLVISFAPAIGPTLSGWIVETYPWRTMFFIILPIIIVDIILVYIFMKNVTERTFPKLDILSIILSTLGFGGLLFGFSSAGNGDGNWLAPQVLISIVVGIVALILFIRRQFQLKQPILEFRVLKSKMFTIGTVIGMIVFMGLIGSETILPIYMQQYADFSALESGLMIMPGAILMGLMSPVTGRIFDKIGARYLAIIGLSVMTVTTFLFTNLSADTSLVFLTVVFGIRMFGMSMVMMPVTTAGLNQLPVHLIAHGTAMNNTLRQVAGSIGTAILVTVMTTSQISNATSDLIHGVNVAFYVATGLTIIGLVLSFFITGTNPQEQANRQNSKA